MNDTTTTTLRAPFQRASLQLKVGAPRGLSAGTHQEMLREAHVADVTLGELIERMWGAYQHAQHTPARNGKRRA